MGPFNLAVTLFAATAFLNNQQLAHGHLSSVCAATHPDRPQQVTFLYGTYHYPPAAGSAVPGTAYVQDPQGTVSQFAFDSFCNMVPEAGQDVLSLSGTVDEFAETLLNFSCVCDKVLGCGSYNHSTGMCTSTSGNCAAVEPALTSVECFGGNDDVPAELGSWGKARERNETFSCAYTYLSLYAVYTATLTNIKSGVFLVSAADMDANLATSPYDEAPCNMAVDTPVALSVSVADGGIQCTEPPSIPTGPECVPSDTNTIVSGYVCQSACPNGEVSVETFACKNGNWPEEAYCLDLNTVQTCAASDVSQVGTNISGIVGEDCFQLTPEDVTCDVVCAVGTWGGGEVTCEVNSTTNLTFWQAEATFQGCNDASSGAYAPNLDITVESDLRCTLPGKLIVDWSFEVVSVTDGFDQIARFEFDAEDSDRIVCGTFTGDAAPAAGHVCTMDSSANSTRVRVRACNSAGCGSWSAWSNEADTTTDADSDGICNDLDICPENPNNVDEDSDGICDTTTTTTTSTTSTTSTATTSTITVVPQSQLSPEESLTLGLGLGIGLFLLLLLIILLWFFLCCRKQKKEQNKIEPQPSNEAKSSLVSESISGPAAKV